ncbi:MAG: OmpA family protein [Ignavibacteriales bacterium]|nr:OmpA family protein [Ignavibacteriales bacterium]
MERRMRTLALGAACLAAALSASAFGQNAPDRVYHPFTASLALGVEGGATFGSIDYAQPTLDYAGKATLEYFFPFYSKSAFGIRLFGKAGYLAGEDDEKNPTTFRTDLVSGGIGVVYAVSIAEVVFPYVFAGGSYLMFDPKTGDREPMPRNAAEGYKREEGNYEAEAGVRIVLAKNLTLNLDVSMKFSPHDNLDDVEDRLDADRVTTYWAGLSYAFFGELDSDKDGVVDSKDLCENTPIWLEVNERGCPKDDDVDGVPNYIDIGPDTPYGVAVDSLGRPLDDDGDGVPNYIDICDATPPEATVDEFGCPLDDDADGVPNYRDQCPDTKQGVPVDAAGCMLDEDNDGVPDNIDQCPGTLENMFVDDRGCAVGPGKFVVPVGEAFNIGGDDLLPRGEILLDDIVEKLRLAPTVNWVVEGHTDSRGSRDLNMRLSEGRARATLNYFVARGLNRDRFSVRAFGPDKPIATNATPQGRAKNRRVVIRRAF